MTKAEVAKLLTIASAVDNRRITEATVNVWHDLIGHLRAEDAFQALREFRKSSPGVYLEPGHILAGVRRAGGGSQAWMNRSTARSIPGGYELADGARVVAGRKEVER